MAVLLGDRSTQDSSGRKIAGVARGEMYTNTKTDDHLSGDGSKHLNWILYCGMLRSFLGKLGPQYGAVQWRTTIWCSAEADHNMVQCSGGPQYGAVQWRTTIWCSALADHNMLRCSGGPQYGAVQWRTTTWCSAVADHNMVQCSGGPQYGAVHWRTDFRKITNTPVRQWIENFWYAERLPACQGGLLSVDLAMDHRLLAS